MPCARIPEPPGVLRPPPRDVLDAQAVHLRSLGNDEVKVATIGSHKLAEARLMY